MFHHSSTVANNASKRHRVTSISNRVQIDVYLEKSLYFKLRFTYATYGKDEKISHMFSSQHISGNLCKWNSSKYLFVRRRIATACASVKPAELVLPLHIRVRNTTSQYSVHLCTVFNQSFLKYFNYNNFRRQINGILSGTSRF